MRQTILLVLDVLSIMIYNNPEYRILYQYVVRVKKTHGSCFNLFTQEGSRFYSNQQDGISNFLLVLEELELPYSHAGANETLNTYVLLQAMVRDFYVLIGLNTDEVLELNRYMANSHMLSHDKTNAVLYNTATVNDIADILGEYPWLTMILLLEIIPAYKAKEVDSRLENIG